MAELSNIRVFISSTSQDLKPFRAVARDVVLQMGWLPIMMEDFGAVPEATVSACHNKLATCQLMLLIQAFRRGWVPTTEQGGDGVKSMTALELEYAKNPPHPISVLALLANETWPGNQWEKDDEGRGWVADFRAKLNLPADFFDYEDPSAMDDRRLPSFRSKVRTVLVAHKERLQKQFAGGAAGGLDFFDSARDAIVSGNCVPFVGSGIYGDGFLGAPALMKALLGDAEPEPAHNLAMVAEFRERFIGDRGPFLNRLGELLNAHSAQTEPPAVLKMLFGEPAPSLVVAATYDQLLEGWLRARKRKFAVVSHVLQSFDNENDGKIVVFRDGTHPLICLADKVELASDEVVVYRPLGSPLLNGFLDPQLAIDTVVITETDHLTFLSRLENEHTKIPTAFSRPLQTRPLLFLGYGLDVWHYRLVMRVFQVVGKRRARIIAVRKPAHPMEELAWKRLGADLVGSDPNEFATRVMQWDSAGDR
jgi:hypothetical protein